MKTHTALLLKAALLTLLASASLQAQSQLASGTCAQTMPNAVLKITVNRVQYAVASADGCWIFAVKAGGLGVLRRSAGTVEEIQLPASVSGVELRITPGMALTHDGKILIVSADNRALLYDVSKLTSGRPDAVMGAVGDYRFGGAGQIVVTRDDKYMFIAQERTAWVSVIDLEKARTGGFGTSAILGGFPAGPNPSFALTADNRFLYVATTWPKQDYVAGLGCRNPAHSPNDREGAILVVDVQRATSSPGASVISTTAASCFPNGIAISPDGNTLYEEARETGTLLVFDTRPAQAGSALKHLASVPLGYVPNGYERNSHGVTVIDGGRRVFVSDPYLDYYKLAVIDAAKAAVPGPGALLGTLPGDRGPRNASLAADGKTLLIAQEFSSTLLIIDLNRVTPEPAPAQSVFVASISRDGSKVTGPAARLSESLAFTDQSPTWSPDGSLIVFKRRDGSADPETSSTFGIVAYSIDQKTEKYYSTAAFTGPGAGGPVRWFPDGQGVVQAGRASGNATGSTSPGTFYRLDLQSGKASDTGIPTPTGGNLLLAIAPGGKTFYIGERAGNSLFVFDTETKQKRSISSIPGISGIQEMTLSPDGRTLAVITPVDSRTKDAVLFRINVDGTGFQELATVPNGKNPVWTKDGQAILFGKSEDPPPLIGPASNSRWQIMRIPASGGPLRFTGLEVQNLLFLDVSPDGSRITFSGLAANTTAAGQ